MPKPIEQRVCVCVCKFIHTYTLFDATQMLDAQTQNVCIAHLIDNGWIGLILAIEGLLMQIISLKHLRASVHITKSFACLAKKKTKQLEKKRKKHSHRMEKACKKNNRQYMSNVICDKCVCVKATRAAKSTKAFCHLNNSNWKTAIVSCTLCTRVYDSLPRAHYAFRAFFFHGGTKRRTRELERDKQTHNWIK